MAEPPPVPRTAGPSGLDLLGRESLSIDVDRIKDSVDGKCILITGAGGSIGGDLAMSCAQLGAAHVVLLELSENALFRISRRFDESGAAYYTPVLGSVRDGELVRELIERHRPRLILHAAAYKHVPLLEHNLVEAIANNALGTRTLVSVAAEAGVPELVFISTDKAVAPTSVLGISKRVGEVCVMAWANRQDGRLPRYGTARLCNVIGSSGSVVEIFSDRIARGLPVQLSDDRAARFFITPEEAVAAVLSTPTFAPQGRVVVTDPGVETPISELAERIACAVNAGGPGIETTGLRPGEKLHESLFVGDAKTEPLPLPWLQLEDQAQPPEGFAACLDSLDQACVARDDKRVIDLLGHLT